MWNAPTGLVMPAAWTCVFGGWPFHRLFERRQGRVNSREFRDGFLRVCVGPLGFLLVDFLFLPRLECQLSGLVSWRASAFACLSDGEAGRFFVDFLKGSLSESLDFYEYWVDFVWATARQVKFSPMFSGLFLKELALSGM